MERAKKPTWNQRAFAIFSDKEIRATAAWWSSLFALTMISGYYMWLGFSPVLSIGQGSILLVQAFLTGIGMTVYYAIALLFPAWSYSVLEIEIEKFPKEQSWEARKSLLYRSITAQTFALSMLFGLWLCLGTDRMGEAALLLMGDVVILGISAIVLLRLPRTTRFGRDESNVQFFWSIAMIGVASFVGAVMLFQLYEFPAKDARASGWYFLGALALVIVASAAISTIREDQAWLKAVFGATAFVLALVACNSGSMPFKTTAGILGIAVFGPVEVVLPTATCTLVKQALNEPKRLECEGERSGRLGDIQLLNTLGERWVIRELGKEENIVFEGKGTVIRKLSPPKKATS